MTSLPTNYRPPSVHGREISTSPNVYNVDPSQAVPRSVKAVSKNSYQFKQWAGAASKTDCSCSDKLRISGKKMLVETVLSSLLDSVTRHKYM